jgi:hypothetical protein
VRLGVGAVHCVRVDGQRQFGGQLSVQLVLVVPDGQFRILVGILHGRRMNAKENMNTEESVRRES